MSSTAVPAASPAAASGLDRLLRRAGLSARSFRALLHAFLLMDLRSQHFGRATATKPNALISPLFWVVGQYLLIGGVTSVVLFARVDAFFFAFVNLGVSMLVIATAVIVEFNEVVSAPDDLDVIRHRPVPARTYSAARLANLLIYVLVMTAALNWFPAVVGLGLRDTGWTFLPAYAIAALLGNLFVVGAVILLYALLRAARPKDEIRDVLAWTQIILILVGVYGGQAIFRDSQMRLEMTAYALPAWVDYLPPAWLARFVDSCAPAHGPPRWRIPLGAALATGAVWCGAAWRLSREYGQMQPGGAAWRRSLLPPLPQPGALLGPWQSRLLRAPAQRSAFWLCSTMLRRDYDLKMRSWPALGVVFAPLLLGLFTGQLGDPFTAQGFQGVLSIACLYLLAFPVPTILYNLNFSRDAAAAWVLRTAPISDRVAFAEGLRQAVTVRILWPALLAVTVVFACVWRDVPHALSHLLAGGLVIAATGHAAQLVLARDFPFATPLARGATLGPIALFAGLLNGLALLLAVVHYYAVRAGWTSFAFYLLGLGLLWLALRGVARRALRRQFARGAPHD